MAGGRGRRSRKAGGVKALVTGCYGFVGHNVAKALLAQGHSVTGTDRTVDAISAKSDRIAESKRAGLRYVEASLANYRAVAEMFAAGRFDVVFHLAAQFPVKHTRATADQYVASNVVALVNVLEAARAHGTRRIVFSSSVAARTQGRPTSMYGASKRFGEEVLHVYSRMGLECAVLRLGAVYGPMMRADAGLWKVASMVLRGRPLPMMTGFRSKHEMVLIDDLADCMAAFCDADLPDRYVLETICAEDYAADFGDAATIIGKIAGVRPVLPPDYETKPRDRMCDMAPIRAIIGRAPETKLDAGLARLVGAMK